MKCCYLLLARKFLKGKPALSSRVTTRMSLEARRSTFGLVSDRRAHPQEETKARCINRNSMRTSKRLGST